MKRTLLLILVAHINSLGCGGHGEDASGFVESVHPVSSSLMAELSDIYNVSFLGSDIPAIWANVGWGEYTVDGNWYGPGFMIGGESFSKGFFAHAASRVGFFLSNSYDWLYFCAGLDDGDGDCGDGADFIVYANGCAVVEPVTKMSGQPVDCFMVSVAGTYVLEMVTDELSNNSCDEAEWVNAVVF